MIRATATAALRAALLTAALVCGGCMFIPFFGSDADFDGDLDREMERLDERRRDRQQRNPNLNPYERDAINGAVGGNPYNLPPRPSLEELEERVEKERAAAEREAAAKK
ncbi:MAG: hypothetical protein LBR07_02720 [Puniceicoccales bacterium]|jgi:hypothetical protein|nr:hypothetical protein [Puniceicoccales bacterium]